MFTRSTEDRGAGTRCAPAVRGAWAGARRRRRQGSELGFHVTLRLDDGRIIARDAVARRLASRIVREQGEARGLIVHAVVKDHIHGLLVCTRAEAGDFCRYVATALRWRLGIPVPFEPARIRALADQRHLENTVGYVLRQHRKHGNWRDPLHDGTSVPDLLGARVLLTSRGRPDGKRRVLGRAATRLLDELAPGYGARDVALRHLGPREALDAEPAWDQLADAACAAFALASLRGGASSLAALARRAAVHAARTHMTSRRIGELLGVGTRCVQALAAVEAEPEHVQAVVLQLRLRGALATGVLVAPGTGGEDDRFQ